MRKFVVVFGLGIMLALTLAPAAWAQQTAGTKPAAQTLPAKFDLREIGAVTPIKKQQGGTCWTHGTMAAIESNLLMTGAWKKLGRKDAPAFSEYHLDWWNGFNRHANDDLTDAAKNPSGLKVHVGGDYRVSAAYMSRGDGIVMVPTDKDGKPDTAGWYKEAPKKNEANYQRFYVRDIEWFVIGPKLEGIEIIKQRLMTEGAIGTAMTVSKSLMARDNFHYQPLESKLKPNHAVAIVGWDDTKITNDTTKPAPPKPGAWLIKNSWGRTKGDQGYYWISYYDKVCCRDEEMGAVSFRNIKPMGYDQIYFHDYHGWRDTMKDVSKACNAFTASGQQTLKAVSFYTAADGVAFTAKIYKRLDKGELFDPVAVKTGVLAVKGFHTIDLDVPVTLVAKDKFYVALELSHGGQAIDRTSEIPVLLQPKPEVKQPAKKPAPGMGPNGPLVLSKANPGESYYWNGSTWKDLYDYQFTNPNWATFDHTANFCMKALVVRTPNGGANQGD